MRLWGGILTGLVALFLLGCASTVSGSHMAQVAETTTEPVQAPSGRPLEDAAHVARELVRGTFEDDVNLWLAVLRERWGGAALRWDKGVRESSDAWTVSATISGKANRRTARWKLALPLEALMEKGEEVGVDDQDGTVTPDNAQARAFQEIPVIETPARKSLALPGTGVSVDVRRRLMEGFVLTEDEITPGTVARSGALLLPLVRGLSWQRKHGRPHPHVALRLDTGTSIRLSPGGKRVSIARFSRFLHKAPFMPLILTWDPTPNTNGQLHRTPLSAVTVSPR